MAKKTYKKIKIKCHLCTKTVAVESGGPKPAEVIQLGMCAKGWAFESIHLALCPACVQGVKDGILSCPEFCGLTEGS